MRLIKFKPELAKETIYFKDEVELVNHLRENGCEEFNKADDQYLIDESYQIGEWEEVYLEYVESVYIYGDGVEYETYKDPDTGRNFLVEVKIVRNLLSQKP